MKAMCAADSFSIMNKALIYRISHFPEQIEKNSIASLNHGSTQTLVSKQTEISSFLYIQLPTTETFYCGKRSDRISCGNIHI